MNGHQRGQSAIFDQRHADGRGDIELLEGRGLGRRQLRAVIVDDEGFTTTQFLHRQ